MRRKVYKITHPSLSGVGECFEEALPSWLANGWVLATDTPAAPVVPAVTPTFHAQAREGKTGLLRGKTVNTPVVNLNQESPGMDLEETI